MNSRSFAAPDGTLLHELEIAPDAPRAVALVVHGYGDHAARYVPLMCALAARGVAARAFDFRGHGRAAGRRGYVSQFGEYVSDLACAALRAREAYPGAPFFLVAHSQGALVTLTWLTSDSPRRPEIAGLILTGAYLELAIEPSAVQRLEAWVFGRLWPTLTLKSPMRTDQLTRDPGMVAQIRADNLCHRVVTPGWFKESRAAQRALPAHWDRVDLPLLVIHGAADSVAKPEAARRFFEAARAADKHWVLLDGGFHEPYADLERERVIGLVSDWVLDRAGPARSAAAPGAPVAP